MKTLTTTLLLTSMFLIGLGQNQPTAFVAGKATSGMVPSKKLKSSRGVIVKSSAGSEKIIVTSFDMEIILAKPYVTEDIITGEFTEHPKVQIFHAEDARFDCEMRLALSDLSIGEKARFLNIKAKGEDSKEEYTFETFVLTVGSE